MSLKLGPTVASGSISASTRFRRDSFCGGPLGTVRTLVPPVREPSPALRTLPSVSLSTLADAQRDLEEAQKQLEAARQQMGQPFIYEEELSEKAATLTEINTKLEFESLQEPRKRGGFR